MQLNMRLQARLAVSNLTILISCHLVGWLRRTLNHSVLLDLVSVVVHCYHKYFQDVKDTVIERKRALNELGKSACL